ncbi:deleted in malignant brain tumors 1 protein-like isoform X2 [Acanthaster planci]|uniref:Deleted in malignant brain tumors 1 protein-like isoform X2 n=1 Tax=Acanthaster planci TaxID=133434 RepID=A0A8B7ZS13_ACAPL|nr:deleted in malignant brain tumors 1 protein-like isoform X2 [Acanthaster planci]
MSNVRCSGSESHLHECPFDGWGAGSNHVLDAGVVCQIDYDFPVRLHGGTSERQGVLQINFQGIWGGVSYDNWDALIDDAVVCRELGFHGPTLSYSIYQRQPLYFGGVECVGDEIALDDCSSGGWLAARSVRSVFVSCQIEDEAFLAVRLVDGLSSKQGRLEVNYGDSWENVNDNYWDDAASSVVCRQLGHFGQNVTVSQNFFGDGGKPVMMPYKFDCRGDEPTLADCQMMSVSESSGFAVGIVCQADEYHPVRLVGGPSNTSGLVEVFFNGNWVAVCRNYDSVDQTYGRVICRQLGYDGSSVLANERFFAGGHGALDMYGMNNIHCSGNETKLTDCTFRGWGVLPCPSHTVGVMCQADEYQVQIAHDELPVTAGRVEVMLHGRWGTICSDGWDKMDASVVCRQLGYIGPSIFLAILYQREVHVPSHLTNVDCTGDEANLADCSLGPLGASCLYVAGVKCQADDDFPVRLVDGSSATEGRVEIFVNDEWRTVCDRSWNSNAARVVCRQLGYTSGLSVAVVGLIFGQGVTSQQLIGVNCSGEENRLIDCISEPDYFCPHFSYQHAGVICQADEDFSIRLVNGSSPRSGHVELFFHGQWSSICNYGFTTSDADVVCRHLGYRGPNIAFLGNVPEEELRPLQISLEACHDPDPRPTLAECLVEQNVPGLYSCNRNAALEVICQSDETFPVRLVDGMSYASGRVEIFFRGQWGTVCSSGWGINDATVICNQLGFDGAEAPVYYSLFGRGSGPVWLRSPQCIGNETRLADCPISAWGTAHPCQDTAGVICNAAFGSTCPPPEVSSVGTGLPTIEVVIPPEHSVANVSWTQPTAVNLPGSYEEQTTCQSIDDSAPPRPCASGDAFGVTYNPLVRYNNLTRVEVAVGPNGTENKSHRCTFYISVRVKNFSPSIGGLLPRLPVHYPEFLFSDSSPGNCSEDVTSNPQFGSLLWPSTEAGSMVESTQKCAPFTSHAGNPVATRNCSLNVQQGIARWKEPHYHSCGEQQNGSLSDEVRKNVLSQVPDAVKAQEVYLKLMSLKLRIDDDLSTGNVSEVSHILHDIASSNVGTPEVTFQFLDATNKIIGLLRNLEASSSVEAGKLTSIAQSIEAQVSVALRQQGTVSIQMDFIQVETVRLNSSEVESGLNFTLVRQDDLLSSVESTSEETGAFAGAEVRVYEKTGDLPPGMIAAVSLPSNLSALNKTVNGNSSLRPIAARFIAFADDTLFPSSRTMRKSQSSKGIRSLIPGAIVSLSVEDVELVNLTEPVVVQFQLPEMTNVKEAVCVFWDFTLKNGVGDWSNAGCELHGVTNGIYKCLCNHATNFAVFVELQEELKSYHRGLNPITQIGCIASAGMYMAILLMYIPLRNLRQRKSGQMFSQFIFALLIMYTVFVAGVDNARVMYVVWCNAVLYVIYNV